MTFQIELEQTSIAAACAQIFSSEAEDRSYNEKIISLHVKLMMDFQNQSSFPVTVYDISAECL